MQIGQHFTLDELTVTSQPWPNRPNTLEIVNLTRLVALVLDPLRVRLGKPIKVTSGYRSPVVNEAVGGAASSQHVRGEAADIKVAGMTPTEVARAIRSLALPVDQCIIEYDDGAGGGWVHVSCSLARTRGEFLTKSKGRPYQPWVDA